MKSLQKDLAAEREELAALKKYDPARMKKNLDANKKKLAEKTRAADLLQKSYKEARAENARLEQRIKELEAQQARKRPTPGNRRLTGSRRRLQPDTGAARRPGASANAAGTGKGSVRYAPG